MKTRNNDKNINRLLVVGNGFDLQAGAKTSYKSFFDSEYYKEKRELAFSWMNEAIQYKHRLFPINYDSSLLNCWDMLFCMQSKNNSKFKNDISWCDVEQVIHDALVRDRPGDFTWQGVYQAMHQYYADSEYDLINIFSRHSEEIAIMCDMLIRLETEWPETVFQNTDAFYKKVLEQLKEFEMCFGLYIHEQTSTNSFQEKTEELVKRLLYNSVISDEVECDFLHTDSFNYSEYDHYSMNFRHLNGDWLHPIFGIDLTEDERKQYPEAECFTKTSRRLFQDVFEESKGSNVEPYKIDTAIIFGHSLNRMDYDYFVYLFNLLRFNSFDERQMGEIQFVYSIYDPNQEKDIKNNIAQAVYSLLNYYEEYWRGKNQNTLINMLRWNNKIKIRKL